MTTVREGRAPELPCDVCGDPLHKLADDLEDVLLKGFRADTINGKVVPSGVKADPVVRLPCNHFFHFDCVNKHFEARRDSGDFPTAQVYQCPKCRMTFRDVRIMPRRIREQYADGDDMDFDDDNDRQSSRVSSIARKITIATCIFAQY
jgi:hypothetical protein